MNSGVTLHGVKVTVCAPCVTPLIYDVVVFVYSDFEGAFVVLRN